jgi:hypothetical protein
VKLKRGNNSTYFVRATCISAKRVYRQLALRQVALRASPHSLFTGTPRTEAYSFCGTFPPLFSQIRGSAVSRFCFVRAARTFLPLRVQGAIINQKSLRNVAAFNMIANTTFFWRERQSTFHPKEITIDKTFALVKISTLFRSHSLVEEHRFAEPETQVQFLLGPPFK